MVTSGVALPVLVTWPRREAHAVVTLAGARLTTAGGDGAGVENVAVDGAQTVPLLFTARARK